MHGERDRLARFRTRQPKAKTAEQERVMVELDWMVDMAKAVGTPCAAVLIVMQYLAWKAQSQTFAFPNTLLIQRGIDRRTKHRVLEKLETAGKIRIERCGTRKAPAVTVLSPKCRLK
jgi:hypothetical protein